MGRKLILILVACLVLVAGGGCVMAHSSKQPIKSVADEASRFEMGKVIKLSVSQTKQFHQEAEYWITHTVDRPRVHITAKRMDEILRKEEGWTGVYNQPKKMKAGLYGEIEVKRIVVFSSGEFAAAAVSKVSPIFTQSPSGDWQIWVCELPEPSILKKK